MPLTIHLAWWYAPGRLYQRSRLLTIEEDQNEDQELPVIFSWVANFKLFFNKVDNLHFFFQCHPFRKDVAWAIAVEWRSLLLVDKLPLGIVASEQHNFRTRRPEEQVKN